MTWLIVSYVLYTAKRDPKVSEDIYGSMPADVSCQYPKTIYILRMVGTNFFIQTTKCRRTKIVGLVKSGPGILMLG